MAGQQSPAILEPVGHMGSLEIQSLLKPQEAELYIIARKKHWLNFYFWLRKSSHI